MIERTTLEQLEGIVKRIPAAKDVNRDGDTVTFKFHDKDDDDITCLINLINEERAAAMLLLPIPQSHKVTAMLVSNVYNARKDAHGTFAYGTAVGDDDFFIILETHISTRGGVTDETIRQQLRTFIEQINTFETTMFKGIGELGPDTSFMKGSGAEGLWRAVGAFTRGFMAS